MSLATAARTTCAPDVAPFHHSLYGLTVESEFPLPGAIEACPGPADVLVRRASNARSVASPVTSVFTLTRDDKDYVFNFPDAVQVVVNETASLIEVSWPKTFTAEYAATYLMNVVMAFVMRVRGHETLHASAALIDDAAVAFVGTSGAGKSTIAAALALRGFRVISEDVVAIVDRGERFDVVSAHTHVRLWPDVAALLFGSADALPLIANEDWKRSFDVRDHFAHGTFELAAIYSIDDRGDCAPRVESLDGAEALLDLMAASYKHDLPISPDEFERLGRIARCVPTRLLRPGSDLATLPAMIDAIRMSVAGW